jgi:stage II sporulation protein AA (anti-sigma F factor antagonist)
LDLAFEIRDKNLIVKLNGELDHHTAEEVREEIDQKIEQNNIKNIIFDFKDMKFMDSSGIGVVIGRYKKVNKLDGQAAVVNMNSHIERIFKMSGLFNIIMRFESKEQAIENL